MRQGPVIALDGPAGAGKSTVAKAIAERLGFQYLDTGAMYRTITYALLQANLHQEDERVIHEFLYQLDLEYVTKDNCVDIYLDGKKVGPEIRSQEVTEWVAHVAGKPTVREFLIHQQRELASRGNIVLDGRDIGTYVFPQAECKVFLSASAEERAKRRWKQLHRRNKQITLAQVKQDILRRDELDTNRSIAPLRIAEDAIYVDTTGRDVHSIVQEIITRCGLQS